MMRCICGERFGATFDELWRLKMHQREHPSHDRFNLNGILVQLPRLLR